MSAKSHLKVGFRAVLRNHAFIRLWVSQGTSQIAQNMVNYLVIVLVERLTGSSTQTGLAILSFLVPGVLFAAIAGVIVDHVNKRTVLLVTTLLRAAVTVGYFVYLLQGRWPVGYLVLIIDLVTFSRTIVNQFFWPAESSAIPLLVDRDHFFTVNTLIGLSTNVFTVIGFVLLGPFLLKFVGVPVVLWVIIALYLVAAVMLWTIPRRACDAVGTNDLQVRWEDGPVHQALQTWRTVLKELRESWDLILRDRPILVAIGYSSVAQALSLMIGTLAPGFVTRVLGLAAEDAVVIIFPAGLGMMLGLLTVRAATKRIGQQHLIDGSMVLTGFALIGLALAPLLQAFPIFPQIEVLHMGHPILWISALWCLILGVANSFILVPTQTLLQDRTPEEAYGRVFANRQLITNIASIGPILLTGAIADLVGIPPVLGAVGGLTLLIAMVSMLYLRAPGSLPSPASARRDTADDENSPVGGRTAGCPNQGDHLQDRPAGQGEEGER